MKDYSLKARMEELNTKTPQTFRKCYKPVGAENHCGMDCFVCDAVFNKYADEINRLLKDK